MAYGAPSPPPIAPRRIRLEASSFCQLRCPSCPTTTGAIQPAIGSGFLKFEDFRQLVDRNPEIERIEISNYGEIFLNPQLVDILEYAHRKHIAVTIENSVNLNNAREDMLEALVRYEVQIMRCSIDGASAETYRIYRVRGDFDAVISNIRAINAFKRQYGSELPRLVWQFIVFGHNEHELPVARAMAAELGMGFNAKMNWDPKLSPIRDENFVRAQLGDAPISRAEYEQKNGHKYLSSLCHQLWDDPQINWDGKMLGCCRNFWGDFGGNAFTDGLAAGVNHEKMQYARQMLTGQRGPRNDIPCSTCEMYQDMQKRARFIDR
ncbi:radical SAM protein [Bradyrhizobium manausense]|uniref:radical SAM protein n=1 Tax=Bradyrhizobium TaxID=374 RepID=UPI001BA63CA4|nr:MULTISPECIES: radical SAM/SPASM domain-containing protein [Bradyrhizobium]MBR0825102.1 radical SAM protein [Bradyrhizobium manausense]UVO32452.1 radical SAM protein [Bradyrhizobium arachidis]